MLARRLWPAAGALLWCAFIALIAFTAHAAEPGKPRWTLINPYPASGAADIAGSAVATRVLRTMQRHVNPSVTDAVARVAQQAVTEAFDAEVFQSRHRVRRSQRLVRPVQPDVTNSEAGSASTFACCVAVRG